MSMFNAFDKIFVQLLSRWGVTILRITVALVFLWFGALKIMGESPVQDLLLSSFSFLPFEFPFVLLGYLEVAIGLGLFFSYALRLTLAVMWLMLLGTFSALFFNPDLFFVGNPFWLTTEGEFVIKNLVLIASGMVIGGRDVRPK